MYSRTDIQDDCVISAFLPEKGDFSHMDLSGREIGDSSFSDCLMQYSDLSSAVIRHSSFINSDLTNVTLESSHEVDVSFDSCLLTGASFLGSTMKKVRFRRCRGLYSVFSGMRADDVAFEDSEFTDSDFSGLSCRKLVMRNCVLHSCSFMGTMLRDIGLDGTTLDGILISDDAHEARGAVLSLENSIAVLGALDVVVDLSK